MSDKQPKYTLISYNGHNEAYQGKMVRQYQDGSLRDDRGYFIERHPAGHIISQDDASTLAHKNAELKRQVARDAANNAVQRGDFKIAYKDMAFIAEIVDAAHQKATNIDDPKAIDAARFVLQVTGYDEKTAAQVVESGNVYQFAQIIHDVAGMLRERVPGND